MIHMPSADSTKKSSHDKINIEALVQRCKKNEPHAWEEFLRHFVPIIRKMIQRILRKYGCPKWNDIDVVQDVWLKIFEYLYAQNGFELCVHYKNFEGWLWSVTNSKAVDYCRRKKRTGPDIEPNDNPVDFENLEEGNWLEKKLCEMESTGDLNNALDTISDMKNPKIKWAIRICIMAEVPLTDAEISSLVKTFNYDDEETVKDQLKTIQARLHKKIMEKRKAGDAADRIWREIQEMEYKLRHVIPFIHENMEEEAEKLVQTLKKKEKRHEELLNEAGQFCHPSSAEIAQIMGLPESKVNQVSIYIYRARLILIEQRKKKLFVIK